MHPKDIEAAVRFEVETYFRLSSGLEEFFEDPIFINADQDPQVVFEYIESYVVNPLPTMPMWKTMKLDIEWLTVEYPLSW